MARKTVLRRKDIIIASCLSVLDIIAVVLFQMMVISPVTTQARQESVKLEKAVKQLEEDNKKQRLLPEVCEENRKMSETLSAFEQRVPRKSSVVVLFADVLRIAADNSLKIVNSKPLDSCPVGQGFVRYPYELVLQGNFTDAGRFIAALETHPSFVEISKIDLGGASNGGVRLNLSVNLYALGDPPAGPPPAALATAGTMTSDPKK